MNKIYGADGNVYETSISNGKEYTSSKKEKEEFAIAELEKIKVRIDKEVAYSNKWQVKNDSIKIIDERISELKGESK